MRAENPIRAYASVTAAYWAFMLSDGALRMLVLLHFNGLGFSPVQLAWLFLLYEVAGVVTNLYAGWLAARFGLASTLFAGLILQIGALVALSQLDPSWGVLASVVFVMAVLVGLLYLITAYYYRERPPTLASEIKRLEGEKR